MSAQNQDGPAGNDQRSGVFIKSEESGRTPEEATGDNDITPEEIKLLDDAGVNESADDDDQLLEEARLDDSDEDGEKLNENIDLSGDDLDVPGSETDDESESIGEEDEENNSYSLSRQNDE